MCLSVTAIPSAVDIEEVETNADSTTDFIEERLSYLVNLKTLYNYLDTIEDITRPGCSSEILDAALESMSQIVINLSLASSASRNHASP